MAKKTPIPSGYTLAFEAIKKRVRAAQYDALKAVNLHLITLYWDIGRIIAERQQEKNWGKSVVERLGSDLRKEFPGISGFSARNIWYMRQILSLLPGKSKTAANGCRNWLDAQPDHSG